METSNKNFLKIIVIVLSIGLVIAIGISSLLYFDNKNLENQVLKREKLIKKTFLEEDALNSKKTKSDSIIKKYIQDCNILINNKKVSTEELLEFINSQLKSIEKLKAENSKLNDSVKIYKSYVKLSKSNLNVDYKTYKKDNKLFSEIIIPSDSLEIYRRLYKLMEKNYGISYDVKSDKEYRYYSSKVTKLDSALYVYKYYKHVLSGDSIGNIIIKLPKNRKRNNSKHKKTD
ncbi:hypothetical protein [uncultured Tenacibaculum sp.]|uniref:hypothetical protein n=1 Tax=uncultured Tenacibaculum sp. TaxID=174713 RepID=UPI00261845DA|nr:hypothetical protein [uncultured Tenacibaculum sp.]